MTARLKLFQGFGVELEYMIVDRETLAIKTIADELMKAVAGEYVSDIERDEIAWSNELVAHVIELKTNGPAPSLQGLDGKFQKNVREINGLLAPMGACLMPTAAHPWMNPDKEMKLWAHEYSEVYNSYNRIFDCRGHGWSNLQSTHINLPFADDEEFGRLHAAIRLVLPIIPALSASSPIIEMKTTGFLDTRLDFYRKNQAKVPSICGDVVPEPVFTEADYRSEIFERTWRDIAPYDTEGVLVGQEFLNSRGAIARFSRGAIEIRVVDLQECPAADLAIVQAIVGVLKALVSEELMDYEAQKRWATAPLKEIFLNCVEAAGGAVVSNGAYLEAMGCRADVFCTARELWRCLAERWTPELLLPGTPLTTILGDGTLALRILRASGDPADPARIRETYRELCQCLAEGRMFRQ